MLPSVCILTTVWNQVDKTLACLATLTQLGYPNYHILLIDNGSSDDTVAQVSAKFPQVEVIQLPENLGFAGGYNVGLRRAIDQEYDTIFVLNNDTLVEPDALSRLVETAVSDPNIGMVTAKIYYNAERNRIWSLGGQIHPWTLEIVEDANDQIDDGSWTEPLDLDFAPLCAVLLRRALLEEVGLFDEAFFLYYEDMDFARRVRQAGYRIVLEPKAIIYHDVSASSGGRYSPNERYWMARSSVIYFRKQAKPLNWLAILPWRTASALKMTIRLLRLGKTAALQAYWRGLWHGIKEEL
ncbi:MAG: glycosyltransferase family 2 protein [Chloroflexota bacterium]